MLNLCYCSLVIILVTQSVQESKNILEIPIWCPTTFSIFSHILKYHIILYQKCGQESMATIYGALFLVFHRCKQLQASFIPTCQWLLGSKGRQTSVERKQILESSEWYSWQMLWEQLRADCKSMKTTEEVSGAWMMLMLNVLPNFLSSASGPGAGLRYTHLRYRNLSQSTPSDIYSYYVF